MANKQLRETLSLDRVAFKERALNELKELNPCDKARAITECLDHFIKERKWVDNINLDEIRVMVTQSNGNDEALVESVMNQVSPRAMAKREPIAKKEDKRELKESLTKTVKESVQLNEGPGAGYSVKGSLANLSDIQILNTLSNINKYDENEITVKAKANCELTGVEASSYYYGREIVEGAAIPATIELNFTYYENEFKGESAEQVVKYFDEFEFDCVVGGGYSHSTFTGVLEGDYNDVEKEPYGCDTSAFIITITNERVIQDIDKAVTGEDWFDNYDVIDRDGDVVDSFDTEDEAVAYAKKNGGVAVEHKQYRYALMNDFESEDIIDEYNEGTVWEREYTKSYKFDDDNMGEAFDKRDLYVNDKYVCSSNRYNSNKDFRNKVMQDRKVKYAGDRAIATSGVEMDELDINQDDVVKVRKAKREAYDNEAKNLIRVNETLKEDYTWHSIDLGTEKAEKLKQFLRDNEIYFEPSSNGDLVHFEIKIDSDDVKDMINKYLDEGLTEGVKEPQEVNATLYYEEDGEPLLVFDTIATNDGKIEVFSIRDGHTAADQGYIDTLKKAKIDDRARALIKHYEDNYPVKVNLQEGLEERWVVFKFEEGNPYVAKTDEEKERILKKYEGRVEQLDDMAYLVKNKTVAEPVKEGYYDEMDEQYADILDKDVDVYNVKQYVLDGTDNKYRTHYTDKYAIIVAPNGKGCVLDYEAVGQDFDNIDDKISFGIEENKDNEWVDEEGNKHTTINVMATHRINTTPKDVMEKAPKETMKFRDFFRKYKYNDRCSANFRGMVKYLKDNGYTGK